MSDRGCVGDGNGGDTGGEDDAGAEGAGGLDRRAVLAGAAGLAGGVAGCLGGAAPARVRVLSAGSLAGVFEDRVAPAFEAETAIALHAEYYGTNAAIRMIEDGTARPDVLVSADAALLRERLYGSFTDWDVEFATNSLGIGYDATTAFGGRLEAGDPWYAVAAASDDGELAIADPDLDPLGYRALQAFELAAAEHGRPGLRERLAAVAYREPDEPQMMTGVESGSRAAAVVYRNMAAGRDVPFLEFPEAYDFSNPALANHYADAEYTTDGGYTAVGRPIVYNAAVNDSADAPEAARRFVRFLVENPELLVEGGLTVTDPVPRSNGPAPEGIAP